MTSDVGLAAHHRAHLTPQMTTRLVLLVAFLWLPSEQLAADVSSVDGWVQRWNRVWVSQRKQGTSQSRPVEMVRRFWKAKHNTRMGCNLPRYDLHSDDIPSDAGAKGPVILTGWEHPALDWQLSKFISTFGEFKQILKNDVVRPVRNNDGDLVQITTREYVDVMNQSRHSILLFTNQVENPYFTSAVQLNYSTPEIVQHIKGIDIFSGAVTAASHALHYHGESWLGQVTGRKAWWFLPPRHGTPKINACHFLRDTNIMDLEEDGMQVCLQNPGEIIWFPDKWVHGTCALDPWTIGVGAQVGNPSVPDLHVDYHS